MIERLMTCDSTMTRDEFVAWWRERIGALSLLLRQVQCGMRSPQDLEEALYPMIETFGALFLTQPSFSDVISIDLATWERRAPPPGWWAAVARAVAPSPIQVPLLATAFKWVRSAHTGLRAECESLARRAVENPEDLALQDAIVAGLARVQLAYRVTASAAKIAALAVLRAEQAATLYVLSYPHMPVVAAILEAMPGVGDAPEPPPL
ncbi:MAG: hypothetical protein J3K34DRAFT_399153 [Monoraphidium minutum]|nr:MAG: hypothetical protein J3K34DRAFT_399153 [Monoraphidium minutum]